ncbi:MAG: hypothetical protein WBS54_00210 [Acidobacteriota bacterium]
MNETERWVREARGYLKAARKSGRESSLGELRDHMKRLDFDRAQTDLGCGEQCEACSWGRLGGYPLRQTCNLVAFMHGLENLQAYQSGTAPTKQLAASLQELLDRLPAPRT